MSPRTQRMIPWILFFAALHMTDSFLSGRTFQEPYFPATPIQAAYLPLLLLLFLDVGVGLLVAYAAGGLIAHFVGHYLAFAPDYFPTFFARWTDGTNRLGLHSALAGRSSQAVLIAYELSMAIGLASGLLDVRRNGWSWHLRRRPRLG